MQSQPFITQREYNARTTAAIAITLTALVTAVFHVYGITKGPATVQNAPVITSFYESTMPVEEKEMLSDIYGRFLSSDDGYSATDRFYQIGQWGNWARALSTVYFHSAKPTSMKIQGTAAQDGVYRIYTEYTGNMDDFRCKEAEYDAEINRLVASVDGQSIENKIRFFHDYLISKCEYDYTLSKGRAYDCLIGGSSVCNGYATAFYNLCSAAGLEVNYIVGKVDNGTGIISHAWNRVKGSDGQWRYYDVTFDDTSRSNAFYGMTEEEMSKQYFAEEII